jgi:rubredoxin
MTYAYYRETKRGTTPSSAPTYLKTETAQEGKRMDKYRCTVCGYIYDPENGDPDSGVKPETPFEELPESWVCPICGATKDQFEKVE